jgi:hypothetical protein
MTKRPALIKRKPKAQRVSRSEAYLVNVKYMGEEPSAKKMLQDPASVFNWYSSMSSKDEAREYMKVYLSAAGRKEDLKKLARVSDTWLPQTACWLARILTVVPEHSEAPRYASQIDKWLNQAFDRLTPEKEEVVAERVSIQDRLRDKISDMIGEIEEMIDSGEQIDLYEWLKKGEYPAMYAQKIIDKYTPWLSELVEAYEGKDEQLNEGYAYLGKKGLKERIAFFGKLLEDAARYGNVTKKTRAPRKPRPVSMEKLLKNFNYQKESNDFKIASIDPQKIVGAQELWCFNTKYKTLTVFRALDRGGLKINRSSIAAYDEKTTLTRGTGRQAEKIVQRVLNDGKISLRKLMDELKTEKPLQERINENTVLLRVVQ